MGNTPALRATFLVEAFNLKAAVEFAMKNHDEAREALTDMPPRAEEELDPVTLHNVALMHMDTDPADGFDKLNFLVSSPDSVPAPPECFANLLLLYVSPAHGFFDLAADVLAEHPVLAKKHLSADAYEYLDAVIAGTRSSGGAFRRLERAANAKAEEMRGLAKSIQDARLRRDAERVKGLAARYDDALEAYVPFLMAQAKIYWDRAHYAQVEKIFRRSALEFCSGPRRLNVAHGYFMRSLRSDDTFGEAIEYYEPIVRAKVESGDVLSVTAIVLANLCVAYIMTRRPGRRVADAAGRARRSACRCAAARAAVPLDHHQPGHRHVVLREGQLRVWHLARHQEPGAVRGEARSGHRRVHLPAPRSRARPRRRPKSGL